LKLFGVQDKPRIEPLVFGNIDVKFKKHTFLPKMLTSKRSWSTVQPPSSKQCFSSYFTKTSGRSMSQWPNSLRIRIISLR